MEWGRGWDNRWKVFDTVRGYAWGSRLGTGYMLKLLKNARSCWFCWCVHYPDIIYAGVSFLWNIFNNILINLAHHMIRCISWSYILHVSRVEHALLVYTCHWHTFNHWCTNWLYIGCIDHNVISAYSMCCKHFITLFTSRLSGSMPVNPCSIFFNSSLLHPYATLTHPGILHCFGFL